MRSQHTNQQASQEPTRHPHAHATPAPPLQTNNWGTPKQLVFHGGVPRSSLQRGDGKWACERGRVSARLVKRSGNPTTNCHNWNCRKTVFLKKPSSQKTDIWKRHVQIMNCIWLNDQQWRPLAPTLLTTGIGHPVLSNCGLSRIQERWKGPANFIALKTSHENLCAFLSVLLQKIIHFQNIHCKPSPVVTHFQRGICLLAPPSEADAQSPCCFTGQFLSLALFSFS